MRNVSVCAMHFQWQVEGKNEKTKHTLPSSMIRMHFVDARCALLIAIRCTSVHKVHWECYLFAIIIITHFELALKLTHEDTYSLSLFKKREILLLLLCSARLPSPLSILPISLLRLPVSSAPSFFVLLCAQRTAYASSPFNARYWKSILSTGRLIVNWLTRACVTFRTINWNPNSREVFYYCRRCNVHERRNGGRGQYVTAAQIIWHFLFIHSVAAPFHCRSAFRHCTYYVRIRL